MINTAKISNIVNLLVVPSLALFSLLIGWRSCEISKAVQNDKSQIYTLDTLINKESDHLGLQQQELIQVKDQAGMLRQENDTLSFILKAPQLQIDNLVALETGQKKELNALYKHALISKHQLERFYRIDSTQRKLDFYALQKAFIDIKGIPYIRRFHPYPSEVTKEFIVMIERTNMELAKGMENNILRGSKTDFYCWEELYKATQNIVFLNNLSKDREGLANNSTTELYDENTLVNTGSIDSILQVRQALWREKYQYFETYFSRLLLKDANK